MSRLREAAEDYLVMRRALGFKLTTWAVPPQRLHRLLRGPPRRTDHHRAARWPGRLEPRAAAATRSTGARRLMVVRIFARHLQTLDPATEVPPEDVLPHHYRRIPPYLYSPSEITALISAAGRLEPPLRAATWQTLIGLLAVTGMRRSEACRLDRDESTWTPAMLVVADSKFGKSRQVFLHPTTIAALRGYERRRDHWCPAPGAPQLLRVHPRHAGWTPTTSPTPSPGWSPMPASRHRPGGAPAAARPAACVHGRHDAGLVPRRR